MAAEFKGVVNVDIRDSVPDWTPYIQAQAPEGAPNVLMIVWDDVGYAALDVMGGPIEAPAMRRIAESGLRYSNFHTTALCSPTRSSLLTGRNATSNNMATITEASSGFPGFSARIPFENGMISEVLNERGWNTYALGKWHLTPGEETDLSSWKGRWPLGRGFERFYGFLGGETNQWYPDLVYDNHFVEAPATPEEGYHLSADLADQAVRFIRDSKSVAPDKPWFMYFCPGAGHAPHHVAKEWSDKYAGTFDEGYEAIRETILARQKSMGLLPEDTALSPINPHGEPDGITGPDGEAWPQLDFVRPWDSLSDDEKKLFSRMAEVFAGFISYTDFQIGRMLDYLEESGQLDNTIVVVVSDNGSSGEGGPNGTYNENRFFNGVPDTIEENMKHIDQLGDPTTYNHYNTGWAWALDTPFPYWKRFVGYEGGTADICLISWPDGIEARGEIRHQYTHAVDLAPTLYDMLGVTPPSVLKGYTQSPIEGESFVESFDNPQAPERRTQFYSMLGQRAIYHEGWLANTLHPPISGWSNFDKDVWELYHLAEDRTQSNNVAAEHPELLEKLKGLWFYNAGKYNGLPLDDRTALEIFATERPQPSKPRDRYVYYPNTSDIPESVAVNVRRRSFTIAAGVVVEEGAEGVLFAHGGAGGGHVLYIQDGHLHYMYNWLAEEHQKISSDRAVETGKHLFVAEFKKTDDDPATGSAVGTLTLYIDTNPVGSAEIRTQPGFFALGGDGLTIGRDSASPVSPDYMPPFVFRGGEIERVVVDVSGDVYVDSEKEAIAWLMRD
ncbi:MAG: arylsulfatase [Acidobacteria bacterium]|nr:MAG: arylsulfatase [Acidobacteriota bacterium]